MLSIKENCKSVEELFYEKFGFVKRIDEDLGYGMILKLN